MVPLAVHNFTLNSLCAFLVVLQRQHNSQASVQFGRLAVRRTGRFAKVHVPHHGLSHVRTHRHQCHQL